MAYYSNNPHNSSKKKAKKPFRKVKNRKGSKMETMHYGLDSYDRKMKFSDKELPESKEWEVGEVYKLEVEVKMTKREDEEGAPAISTYEVLKVKNSG